MDQTWWYCKWLGVDKILSGMYKIFNQSPSKKADYEMITDGLYPLQFCSHWGVENEKVALQAINIWDNIDTFINSWMELLKARQPLEKKKPFSFENCSYQSPLVGEVQIL